ncbi:hypothetical protein P9112_009871 [Eukaryota sp. TZLM1-RC]
MLTLYYYAARGTADKIRLFLAEAGATFDEVIVNQKNFESLSAQFPFEQLPTLKDSDCEMYLSGDMTIMRYIARKFNLYGNNITEQSTIDMWAEVANTFQHDLWRARFMQCSLSDLKVTELKARWITDNTQRFVALASKISQLTTVFVCGKSLSYADICLYAFLDSLAREVPLALITFPPLEKFHSYFNSRPAIKKLTTSGMRY